MAGKHFKKRLPGLALLLAAFLGVSARAAQEPLFSLSLDSQNLQAGVGARLIVSMVNAQGAQVVGIEGLESFELLSQSHSTSTSVIQGAVSSQFDLYLTVMPKTAGAFRLKAIIQHDGQLHETNVLEVNVGEASAGAGEAAPDLFVETTLSHSSAFLGEKVVLTYELYSRYNVESYGFTDYTGIHGMLVREMPQNRLASEYVYAGGVRYARYEVKQLLLDPVQSGLYTLPALTLQVNVVTTDPMGGLGMSPFGGFGGFFGFSEPVYLQTEAKELLVTPLPQEGRPADFSGIVGQLLLEGEYSRSEMNYGDSFVLRASASGGCNLDGLQSIVSGELPGLAIYETQKNAAESVEDHRYWAEKAFEAILVPGSGGVLDVPPISLSYFNPASGQYERAEIPGVTVRVLGDMPGAVSGQADAQAVRIEQARYAAADDGYFAVLIPKRTLRAMGIGAAALPVPALALWRLLSVRKKRDRVFARLNRQLKAARNADEAYGLLNNLIKHCYGLSIKASSQSAVLGGLPDAELAVMVVSLMRDMESAASRGEEGDRAFYAALRESIKGISRGIRAARRAGGPAKAPGGVGAV